MFESAFILPAQLSFLRRRPLQSEQRLLLAILEDAVTCFQIYLFSTKPRELRLFQEAEEWINSANATWAFSFENVCEALELHPASVRNALQRWKAEQLLSYGTLTQDRQPQEA